MGANLALTSLTCAQASRLIHDGQVKPSELISAVLDASHALNDRLKCYGLLTAERALRQASALDELLQSGVDLGPLHGIPVGIKDCIDTAGIPTTMGSPIEEHRVPNHDATLVHYLYRAGAVLIGKTNLYEWAYGGPSTLWGEAFNPWDLEYTTGASSNGSAVAVAAGLAMGAVGTDTGGSIRLPAGFCGVLGLKPTYGRVSRFGVFPPGSSLDHAGPIVRDAEGAAIMLNAMAGYDRRDSATWTAPPPADYLSSIAQSVKGLRIGVPNRQDREVLAQEVEVALAQSVDILNDAGCHVVAIDLPSLLDARTIMWTVSGAEAAEAHRSHLRSRSAEYHPNVRRLLAVGEFTPAAEYVHCFRVRQLMMNQMADIFGRVEAILMPCIPLAPWPSGQTRFELDGLVEDDMSLLSRYCPLFNVTGHPAASMLAGFTSGGLPLSVQIAAPMFDESTILRIARVFERATDHMQRRPNLAL